MKQLLKFISVGSLLFFIAGCSSRDVKQEKTAKSTDQTEETAVSQTKDVSETNTFSATLSENVQTLDDSVISLSLTEVAAIHDPNNILSSFQNGVILHVPTEKLNTKKKTLEKGMKVAFVLTEMPIMTKSFPPQIPGDSIVAVTI